MTVSILITHLMILFKKDKVSKQTEMLEWFSLFNLVVLTFVLRANYDSEK